MDVNNPVFKDIITGKICPYCLNASELVDSRQVYGTDHNYGMMYVCTPCNAWVGTHKGTVNALGRLANEPLRELKKEAHRLFDNLWIRKMKSDRVSQKEARAAAYKWLAAQLGIDPKFCHIGMFDIQTCNAAIRICRPFFKQI